MHVPIESLDDFILGIIFRLVPHLNRCWFKR
jgi:hypothetical protein